MTVEFDFKVTGMKLAQSWLKKASRKMTDLAPFFRTEAKHFQSKMASQFASQGQDAGGWAPLEEGYAAWKAARYPGTLTLYREGGLRASFLNPSAEGHVEMIYPQHAIFGSSLPLAGYHQHGTDIMPERPIVVVTADDRAGYRERLGKYAREAVERM